jgi:hypothetical protein
LPLNQLTLVASLSTVCGPLAIFKWQNCLISVPLILG